MLIDDEPALSRALVAILSDDHDVVAVPNGSDAIALLARDAAYDVILCDLMMPGTSGMDVWRVVSTAAPPLAGRFVFVSGGAFTAEASAFLEGRPHLEKPFDVDQLRAALRARVAGA